MDDVIYILIAVAWVAFSLYNANQKKKQRLARETKTSKPQPEVVPKRRSILEEILMGEEMPVYEEQPEYVEIEPELVPEYKAALEYQQEVLTRTKHTEHERKPIDYQSIIEHSEPATVYGVANSETKNAFNLRQAVIYSVILERPYR